MEDDVCVTMAGEAAAVGNFYAAEHDGSFAGECMDVETHAGPRLHSSGEPLLRSFEVGWRRQLRRARDLLRQPRLPCRRHGATVVSSVGEEPRPSVRKPTLRAVQPKGLRRLHAHEAGPIDRLLERVAELARACRQPEAPARPHRRIPGWRAAGRRRPLGRRDGRHRGPAPRRRRAAARPARTESARSAPPSIRSPTSSPSSAACRLLLLPFANHDTD